MQFRLRTKKEINGKFLVSKLGILKILQIIIEMCFLVVNCGVRGPAESNVPLITSLTNAIYSVCLSSSSLIIGSFFRADNHFFAVYEAALLVISGVGNLFIYGSLSMLSKFTANSTESEQEDLTNPTIDGVSNLYDNLEEVNETDVIEPPSGGLNVATIFGFSSGSECFYMSSLFFFIQMFVAFFAIAWRFNFRKLCKRKSRIWRRSTEEVIEIGADDALLPDLKSFNIFGKESERIAMKELRSSRRKVKLIDLNQPSTSDYEPENVDEESFIEIHAEEDGKKVC